MDELNFEWDENKNKINKHKHGISFEEARSVFSMIILSCLIPLNIPEVKKDF